MSKKLVTLDDRVPLDAPIESLGVHEPDYKALIAFLKSMGFKTLIQRVAEKSGVDATQVESNSADSTPAAKPSAAPAPSSRTAGQGQLPLDVSTPRKTAGPSTSALTPISLAERRLASLRQVKLDTAKYETIETLDRLQHWITRAHETGVLALKAETSMMILVSISRRSGMFQYLAIWSAKAAKAHPAGILFILQITTAVLSAFLDNVTTVLLIVPVTLAICNTLKVPAYPYLFAEIFASNIGGTATLIGDPPNILIGSQVGLSFNEFVYHLTPIIIVVMVVQAVIIHFLWGNDLKASSTAEARVMSAG